MLALLCPHPQSVCRHSVPEEENVYFEKETPGRHNVSHPTTQSVVSLLFRNNNGIMMTEYNPNYEFAGGSCSIQDLREVDRENLVLVK